MDSLLKVVCMLPTVQALLSSGIDLIAIEPQRRFEKAVGQCLRSTLANYATIEVHLFKDSDALSSLLAMLVCCHARMRIQWIR